MSDARGALTGAASAAHTTGALDRHPPFAKSSCDETTLQFCAFLGTARKAAAGAEQGARLEHSIVYA